jgi:hypothetical protein
MFEEPTEKEMVDYLYNIYKTEGGLDLNLQMMYPQHILDALEIRIKADRIAYDECKFRKHTDQRMDNNT